MLPQGKPALLRRFESMLEPVAPERLERMAQESMRVTRRHFGRTMRLFAPVYVSNECVNNCAYCGFSRDNPILRVTLTIDQVVKEARHLAVEGFRHVLLVAGEHPKFVSDGYLEECIRAIKGFIPTVAIEVGPMEAPEYERMVAAGAEGLVVYQETYQRETYARLHTAGPKKNFDWRLECPERGYEGGFRRIGIGALFGLAPWREEAVALAAHLEWLQRHCWKASYTVAMPRMRPAAGGFVPEFGFTDAEFVQLLCAFRLCFPQVGIVLSTRETPALRDAVLPLGVTSMSAGSHTEPGGYTGQGKDDLHITRKGRRVELEEKSVEDRATGQFDIADERTPREIEVLLRRLGLDPVWKDWDEAILDNAPAA
ncbi:MAG: biotin and thiamine synthesis associated [Verrucomicrobiales bacterium]|nr:biotin and thiamine synthesis associated [Verrucomicrobiales bacterium]